MIKKKTLSPGGYDNRKKIRGLPTSRWFRGLQGGITVSADFQHRREDAPKDTPTYIIVTLGACRAPHCPPSSLSRVPCSSLQLTHFKPHRLAQEGALGTSSGHK